jgi:ParB family transcriptional regulator, chromosome partitioning protein
MLSALPLNLYPLPERSSHDYERSCVDCPKRTGHNVLLFESMGRHPDSCSDPKCYASKVDAHVRRTIAAKPRLVKISTYYGKPKDGSTAVPRNSYTVIRQDKPQKKEQRDWPEYKTCKSTSEAIVTEGAEKGETLRVCANPDCPVHHPKKQQRTQADAAAKVEQEKRRREEAVAQTTGLRVLKAIGEAVPVRLMKRDLLFIADRLTPMLDEKRRMILIRQHSVGKPKDGGSPARLLLGFLRQADESTLGRVLAEVAILQSLRTDSDAAKGLHDAAQHYKVDVGAVTAKVKQEFAVKQKARPAAKTASPPKVQPTKKKTA